MEVSIAFMMYLQRETHRTTWGMGVCCFLVGALKKKLPNWHRPPWTSRIAWDDNPRFKGTRATMQMPQIKNVMTVTRILYVHNEFQAVAWMVSKCRDVCHATVQLSTPEDQMVKIHGTGDPHESSMEWSQPVSRHRKSPPFQSHLSIGWVNYHTLW